MTVLKKRPVAIVIAAAVILGSTLFSAHRGLTRQCEAVARQFYTGAAGDYTGIGQQLDLAADSANQLTAELAVQGIEAPELRQARVTLLDARDGDDLHRVYTAAETMFDAAETLYGTLDIGALPEDSQFYLAQAMDALRGARRVIRDSGYNAAVEALQTETLSRFPADILGSLTGVEAPSLYE